MITWNQLLPCHRTLMAFKLGRTPDVEDNYAAFKSIIVDVRTFIYEKLIRSKCPVILQNNFPYDLDDDIEHYCLWWLKDPPQTFYCREVETIITERFPGQTAIYFENRPEDRSIREIRHLHIFVRKSDAALQID
jgi:hypothetical protein